MTRGGGVIENPAAAAFGGVTGKKCQKMPSCWGGQQKLSIYFL